MTKLILATRGSELALAQSRMVARALEKATPGLQIEIQTVRTAGDQDTTTALWKMSGVGFFTTQVEEALLNESAHLAVHSFKDMPTQVTDGLTIAAISQREHPEDVLVARMPLECPADLPCGARVGTSSPRRIAMLRAARPDLEIRQLRGNVPTRLSRVAEGPLDAVVLARAGLVRLGLADRITCVLDPMEFIPAPAQGALAIQCRANDKKAIEILRAVDHEPTRLAVEAERLVLTRLHPGCHAPVGVYARIEGERISIRGFVADMEGGRMVRDEACGPVADRLDLAERLATALLKNGGKEILEELEDHEQG